MEEYKLRVEGIEKSFPGVKALSNISFAVRKGTVHALCGENGAGKSTLMKVLTGLYKADAGQIFIDGKPVEIRNPIQARDYGISMIAQELNYVSELSVEENLFMGRLPVTRFGRVDWKKVRQEAVRFLQEEHLNYAPDQKLKTLTVSDAAQAPYVKAIADAGIPVVTTNPTTHQADLDGETGDPEVDNAVMEGTGTVDADPVAQAAVGAKRAVDEVPENANVVVFRGPSGNYHAEKRREAWDTYFFDVRDDVNILYEDYANWNNDEAMALMETWVQAGTHIDAIISMNDNMAAGAIEAVRNNTDYIAEDGTSNFLAYGVDETAQGCLLIKEGLLTATALQDAGEIAELNMKYADAVLKGEMEYTEVNDYVDAPEINADNVDEFLQIYIDNGELQEEVLG